MNRTAPWQMPEAEWRPIINRVRAGRELRPTHWPDGARCALALSFDADHETFELGAGRSTVGRLSWGEYGRRRGVPRVLEVLRRHKAPASFFVPAVAALVAPAALDPILADGHEIGVHGWIHENTSVLDKTTEARLIGQAADTLEKLTGKRPVGHRAAHWDLSPNTIALVRDLGFSYDSSLMADDECYELLCDGAPSGVVEIPVDWSRDDAAYLLFNREPATRPWTDPAVVLDIFRREFDAARAEGGLCQLVFHPFVIGYRSRIWILDALLEHARACGDVWICTHADLADWVRRA